MPTATLEAPPTQAPVVTAQNIESHEMAKPDIEFSAEELPRKRLMTADDFMRMAEAGWFAEQRVELIAGDFIIMPPITEPHSRCVARISTALSLALHENFMIRPQTSFAASENSYPEPDIAVVSLDILTSDAIPSQAALIVEVSKSTLRYDQTTKVSLYASVGIPDYWIVNLIENQVEVYRQPIESVSAQFGFNYASRQIYQRGQSIGLLEVPKVSIDVDAMLPSV